MTPLLRPLSLPGRFPIFVVSGCFAVALNDVAICVTGKIMQLEQEIAEMG